MQAYIEKEDSKKLKQKQRERMQPKMGKMDIDYQVNFLPHAQYNYSYFWQNV
jgi:ribonuclease HII